MPCCRTQTHTGTWDGCKGVSLKMWKMKMIICNIFYKTPHGYIWSERSEVGCRWEIKKFLPDFWNVRQGDNVDVVCDIVTGCRLCVTQSVHVTHLISLWWLIDPESVDIKQSFFFIFDLRWHQNCTRGLKFSSKWEFTQTVTWDWAWQSRSLCQVWHVTPVY